MRPNVELRPVVETTGTDIAWYTTLNIEYDTGTRAHTYDVDMRSGKQSTSLVNNSWNNTYSDMLSCKDILKKTDLTTGSESNNFRTSRITQVLLVYNLSVPTNIWGNIPWTSALKGTAVMKPTHYTQ